MPGAGQTLEKDGESVQFHDRLIVIDGLNVSNFSRSVFEDMRRGGVTAANCTSCVWENFTDTMRNFARWKAWLQRERRPHHPGHHHR